MELKDIFFCPCLSLFVPVCPFLSLLCPCLSLFVPVCPFLSPFVPLSLCRCSSTMGSTPVAAQSISRFYKDEITHKGTMVFFQQDLLIVLKRVAPRTLVSTTPRTLVSTPLGSTTTVPLFRPSSEIDSHRSKNRSPKLSTRPSNRSPHLDSPDRLHLVPLLRRER